MFHPSIMRFGWSCVSVSTIGFVFALASVLPAARGSVVDSTWIGGGMGNWSTTGNWSPAGAPNNAADTYRVFIDGGGSIASTALLDISPTIAWLDISADDQLVFNNGVSLTLSDPAGPTTAHNAGTIRYTAGAGTSLLVVGGSTMTLAGGGTFDFGASGGRIVGSGTLSLGNQHFSGLGALGTVAGNSLAIRIPAGGVVEHSADFFTINAANLGSAAFVNDGILRQTAANGTVILNGAGGGSFINNGTIEAADGVVTLADATVVGGTLAAGAGGTFFLPATKSAALKDVTLHARFLLAPGSSIPALQPTTLTLAGTIANAGTIDAFGNLGGPVDIRIDGAVTLTGGGILNARLLDPAWRVLGNGTVTNSSHTIKGTLDLGEDQLCVINAADGIIDPTRMEIDPGNFGSTAFVNNGHIRTASLGQLTFTGAGGGSFTNNGSVTLGGNGSIRFISNATFFNNGTMTVGAGGSISFAAGTTFQGGWSGNGSGGFINHAPGSTLEVAGVHLDGVLAQNGSASLGHVVGSGTLAANTAGQTLADHLRISSLIVATQTLLRIKPDGTNSGASKLKQLVISSTGRLDLTDNDLILDYADRSPATMIRAMLKSGYADGAWNGPGINSSLAAGSSPATAFGYLDNTAGAYTTFAGMPVDHTSILIQYTFAGDANLDGVVDMADLSALSTNWQAPAPWVGGDFNYDGIVDITDLAILATNWQAGAGTASVRFEQALASVGLGGVAVPEPSALAALLLLPLGARRRRTCCARATRAKKIRARRGTWDEPAGRGVPKSV